MNRPGHGRPIGTLTAPRRFKPFEGRPPELDDVALQVTGPGGDPDELERAFLLVGIEETASRGWPWRLTFERIAYDDPRVLERVSTNDARLWSFFTLP